MNSEYEVAIMMSTYNGVKYLDEQLNSIYEQSDRNILVYIRDDGSTDDTINIIHKWKSKMNILMYKDCGNLGPAYSFWKLLLTVPKAQIYGFCDQDDIWDSDKIEIAFQYLSKKRDVALYCSNSRLINEHNEIIKEKCYEVNPILTIPSQLVCGSIQGCAMFFNHKLLEQIRKMSISFIPMHDIIIMLYATAIGEVFYDETPRFSRRVHENNVVARAKKNIWRKSYDTYRLWIFAGRRCSLSKVAYELRKNCGKYLTTDDDFYLKCLENYKKGLSFKRKLLKSPLTVSNNMRGLRSFKMRIVLGLL